MTKVNGKTEAVTGLNIAEIVEKFGYNKARVAVELNGNIVPKTKYAETVAEENDVIEIVSFVGGG